MSLLLTNGNALSIPLADKSVHCIVTSPPYYNLRDYQTATWEGGDPVCDHVAVKKSSLESGLRNDGRKHKGLYEGEKAVEIVQQYRDTCGKCGAIRIDNQIGLESTLEAYVANMVAVFRELKRVLRDDGTVWLVIGDSYNGSGGEHKQGGQSGIGIKNRERVGAGIGRKDVSSLKPKDMCLVPARVALALQEDGWYVRAAPPWVKGNGMPESVTDRPTTSHETVYLLTKSKHYYYDSYAIRKKAAYDGRRDTRMKGSIKYKEPAMPGSTVNSMAERGHERWPNTDGNGVRMRNQRTSDYFMDSLDALISDIESYLGHLKSVRSDGGMLVDFGGNPLAILANTTPFLGAHFATFPPALVEPMIKASTSEYGVCPGCGAPYHRVIEKGYRAPADEKVIAEMEAKGVPRQKANLYGHNTREPKFYVDDPDRFVGWEAGCDCNAGEPVPAVVLDPFVGSGTTLLVARQLGRSGIGVDLSYDYLHNQARSRLELDKLDAWANGVKAAESLSDLPLFQEIGHET